MMKDRMALYADCLVSLFVWKFLHKNGTSRKMYRLSNDERYWIRKYSMDSVILYENVIDGVYDPYIPKLNSGDVVVDIGAHVGSFCIHLVKRFPTVHVISIEPIAQNFMLLNRNCQLNNVKKNIRTVPNGIAKKSGKRLFYIDPTNTAGHTLQASQSKSALSVQCTTLRNLFLQNHISECKLLKLDCEGAEYEILLNCPRTLFRKIETIVAELHDSIQTPKLVKMLEENGFTCRVVRGLQNPLLRHIFFVPLLVAQKNTF